MIRVRVNGREAAAVSTEPITTGSVGIPVKFSFSEAWDGLDKLAVFKSGDTAVDILLNDDGCTVPPEVLTTADEALRVGVYGTDETGEVVIPTVWAQVGNVQPGAEPSGIDPTPPTPSLVEQLLTAAKNAEETAQSVRDDADAGVFDGATGPQGIQGPQGKKGDTGARGEPGYSPVRGVDYWTADDVESVVAAAVNAALAAYPVSEEAEF